MAIESRASRDSVIAFRNIMQRRRKMVELDWEETSGVDHPATGLEGWMVMKSEDSNMVATLTEEDLDELEELLDEAGEDMSKSKALYTALDGANLSKAPEAVQAAVTKLLSYLKREGFAKDADEDDTDSDSDSDSEGLEKSVHKRRKKDATRMGQLLSMARRLLSKDTIKDSEADEEAAVKLMDALRVTWPVFVSKAATIMSEAGDIEVRQTKLQLALVGFADETKRKMAA